MKKIQILVKPYARSNSWGKDEAGNLWMRITAPPAEGNANEACIRYLSEILAIPKSSIFLEKGKSGRLKQFCFNDEVDLTMFG